MTHEAFTITEKQARKAGAQIIDGGRYVLYMPKDPTTCSPKIATFTKYSQHVADTLIDMPTAFRI